MCIKKIFLTAAFTITTLATGSMAAEETVQNETLVIREGLQIKQTGIAVEGRYLDGVLDVAIEVRMYSERPRIRNVQIVGPKLGRMSYDRKKNIPLGLEEEDPYEIKRKGHWRPGSFRTERKKLKGTVTRERFLFKIPWDKIVPGKKYQLWIDVDSKTREGKGKKYKFALDKLAEFRPQ